MRGLEVVGHLDDHALGMGQGPRGGSLRRHRFEGAPQAPEELVLALVDAQVRDLAALGLQRGEPVGGGLQVVVSTAPG